MVKDITKIKRTYKPVENLIRKGIQDLKGMHMVIKQADKNLGLVPIRGDYYAAMLRKWLRQPAFHKVQIFPFADILTRINNTIRYTKAITTKQKEDWAKHIENAKDPCPFYVSPKIHKPDPLASRPISAQHSYILAPLSKALANVLLKEQYKHPEITADTISFINRIETFQTTESFVFLTYDVEACYPNIDIHDAIKTLQDNIKELRENNYFWTKILKLIMFNNYVIANENIYRQLTGTATGTQAAPPFANLYLYFKFKNILEDPSILLQERFIDDGFLLTKTIEDAKRITKDLNNATNLTLTYSINQNEAIFLDLTVYKGDRYKSEKKLDLKPYFKPTNRLLYMPMISHHPHSMKAGIVKGEAIRLLRNSTSKLEWLKALEFIFKGLMARGYKPQLIKKAWREIRWEDRTYYITCRTSKEKPAGQLIFTNYNPSTKEVWKLLLAKHKFQKIFIQRRFKWNKKQDEIMNQWPPLIVWRDFKKVSHLTISSKQGWQYKFLGKRKRSEETSHTNKKQKVTK